MLKTNRADPDMIRSVCYKSDQHSFEIKTIKKCNFRQYVKGLEF